MSDGDGDGGELTKGENLTGELEVKQRSFLEAGGDAELGEFCKSSKNDLFPHTIADILCVRFTKSNTKSIQLLVKTLTINPIWSD